MGYNKVIWKRVDHDGAIINTELSMICQYTNIAPTSYFNYPQIDTPYHIKYDVQNSWSGPGYFPALGYLDNYIYYGKDFFKVSDYCNLAIANSLADSWIDYAYGNSSTKPSQYLVIGRNSYYTWNGIKFAPAIRFANQSQGNSTFNIKIGFININTSPTSAVDDVACSFLGLYYSRSSDGFTADQVKVFTNNVINSLSKIKIYPLRSVNNNYPSGGIMTLYFPTQYNYQRLRVYFIARLDKTSIINGAYGFTYGGYYEMPSDQIVFTSEEVDPTDPKVIDDPYDQDPDNPNGPTGEIPPGSGGGDGDFDDTTDPITTPDLPGINMSSASGMMTVYNPSSSQLSSLGQYLWSTNPLDIIAQYFSNPMDVILGCGIIPVSPTTGGSRNIKLALLDSGVSANVVTSDYKIVNCGSIPIERYYGSYLDYNPYTKISAYLPYVGEVDLDVDEITGKTISITYHINVITGECVAMIFADSSLVASAAGNCMEQIPVTSHDYSSIISSAVAMVETIALAAMTSGASTAAEAGAEGALAGEVLEQQAIEAVKVGTASLNQVMSQKARYQHIAKMGGGSGHLAYHFPYLIIERPNLNLAENYKSYVGYPCNMTLTLGDCSGFTIVEISQLSIPTATEQEINEAIQLLKTGVIF